MFVDDEDIPNATSQTVVRNESSEERVTVIREVASLLPSKTIKKKPLVASKTVVRNETCEETVAKIVDEEDVPKINDKVQEEDDNDHPVMIYDSRASNTPTEEMDKAQTGSSRALSAVPGTSGTITKREDKHIEEIQRNDSSFVIKNFSITWTISSSSPTNTCAYPASKIENVSYLLTT